MINVITAKPLEKQYVVVDDKLRLILVFLVYIKDATK